jgi:xanthine dehydrogenase accessory factor
MAIVLICGCGDVGSAVAHVLFKEHHHVVLCDDAAPTHTRRGMAFTDAYFDGKAELENVLAKRSALGEHLQSMLVCGRAIPALTSDWHDIIEASPVDVIVDAGMKKRTVPETFKGAASLTTGLGPNFIAGVTSDLVIETSWDAPGKIITSGPSLPLHGEPQSLGGHGRERYVYAPDAGVFDTQLAIGDRVESEQIIATLAGKPILAPLSGRLRGLTHAGVAVAQGAKIVEVDPREPDANLFGIGERPRQIAAGVLRAIR